MMPRQGDAGLTLVEMLVALVLFALVGLASFTTLDAIIRVRDRTDGRLEQIARIDRALQLFSRDLMQSAAGQLRLDDGVLTVGRVSAPPLTWLADDGALKRQRDSGDGGDLSQTLLDQTDTVAFRVRDTAGPWSDVWPAATPGPDAVAVEMRIELAAPQGTLLRLAEVPRPVPPPSADPLAGTPVTGQAAPQP